MTADDLFNTYKRTLEWIERRLKPDTLKFYGDEARDWKYAKDVAFSMYQSLRHYVDGGVPKFDESVFYDKSLVEGVEPYKIEYNVNGETRISEFPAIGVLKYRGNEYVIYNDDYGMNSFIVLDGRTLQIDGLGGMTDWYYMIDLSIDRIGELEEK